MGQKEMGAEAMFEAWMNSATGFWNMMTKPWTAETGSHKESSPTGKTRKNSVTDSVNTALKMWQSVASMMNEPETQDSLHQGMNALPEIFLKMARSGLERSFQLQQQWMERAGRVGSRTEAYSFENLDQDIFNAWTEIYKEEFSKFLNVPQLGLTRSYQERMGRFMDRFNLFQGAMAHFMSVLYLPVEKSIKVLQDEIETLTEEKKLPHNSQEYYRMWIKILEGHYMTLFKSSQYTEVLKKALDAMGDFMMARRDVLEDLIQTLPVPTQKDMDELYKELYLLKKKVRQLEKKV
jgi:polyhydroxyalkanoate synthase subunit PhaE